MNSTELLLKSTKNHVIQISSEHFVNFTNLFSVYGVSQASEVFDFVYTSVLCREKIPEISLQLFRLLYILVTKMYLY